MGRWADPGKRRATASELSFAGQALPASAHTQDTACFLALLPSGIGFALLTHMREVQVREEGNEDE